MRRSMSMCRGLVVLLALAGCQVRKEAPLRIGINPWPAWEYLYLAQEKGIFREEGLDVRLIEYTSLGDCCRAFERGQIDGMTCTLVELLRARERSPREPQVVLVTDYSNGGDVVLARSPISRISELRGKRVGVETASLGTYVLSRALATDGLTLDDVTIVPLDQLDLEAAIANDEVDAVVSYPPVSVEILRAGEASPLFSSAQIPGEILDVVAIDADVIARRGEDVARLARGWERAKEFAREQPAAADVRMASREGLSVEEFRESLALIHIYSLADQRELLGPGGPVEATIRMTDSILRAAGEIRGPSRVASAIAPTSTAGIAAR